MMHVSRSEDYALILVQSLTKAYKKRLIPLSEIAKKHNLSLLFLRNIAASLKRVGFITAIEGRKGGYKLLKDPKSIQLGNIIEASSKKTFLSCCQKTKDGKCQAKTCPHGFSLRRLQNQFLEQIYHIKLSEITKNA
ncbi:MAG: Rrf2 family transcriptional regulator [Candidatus Levybacteria bacterium]|nr:Rrf2 family transcriptional regulator [Candidatus Levybacteria bacterium]